MAIDLRECKKGDILISSQGATLKYISPTPFNGFTYLDHVVQYIKDGNGKKFPEKCFGTRTHDGYVFALNRMKTDHDIIKIIKIKNNKMSIKHQDFVKIFEETNKNRDLTKQKLQLTESAFQWHKCKYNKNRRNKDDKRYISNKQFATVFFNTNGDKQRTKDLLGLNDHSFKYHYKKWRIINNLPKQKVGVQHADFVEIYEKLNKDATETKRALHLSKPAFNYHKWIYDKNNKAKQLSSQIEKIKNKQFGVASKEVNKLTPSIDLFSNVSKNDKNLLIDLNRIMEKEKFLFEEDKNYSKNILAKRNVRVFEEVYKYFDGNKEEIKKYLSLNDILYNYYYYKSNNWFKPQKAETLVDDNFRHYNLTFAELIDRLSIVMLKKVFIKDNSDEYENEISLIKKDIINQLSKKNFVSVSNAINIVDIMTTSMYIILCNRVIWENESQVRNGQDQDFSKLRFTHSLNGVRNQLKNFISKNLNERIDLKTDCLADDMQEVGNWNKILLDLNKN